MMNYPVSLISRGRLDFRCFQTPLMVLQENITAKRDYRKDNMTFTFWSFMTQITPPAPTLLWGQICIYLTGSMILFSAFAGHYTLNITETFTANVLH